MFIYILRRLLLAIPTLFGITIVTFTIINLAPGDPAKARSDQLNIQDAKMSNEVYEQIRKQWGLDKPIMTRYKIWLIGESKEYDDNGEINNPNRARGILRGDFGKSMSTDPRQVVDKIKERLFPTMSLAILAISFSMLFAIPIGIKAAVKQNQTFDNVSSTVLYALYSIPPYVMAVPLILLVSVKWGILPYQGMKSDNYEQLSNMGQIFDLIKHYVLITFCSSFGSWAFYSRFVRQNMLEVLRQDYIRTARAKGLDEKTVIMKHAFRNTLIPVMTLLGMVLPALIGGSVILEVMFNWPGMGQLFFNSMMERDYSTIMAMTFISATLVLLGMLVSDLSYAIVDPRVKYD